MGESEFVSMEALRSPKLSVVKGQQWYRYYAGFSPKFVRDSYELLELGPDDRVLDPWMGSGTTLSVVAGRGSAVSGIDLNPAMSVIAKGRLVAVDTEASIEPLANEIVKHWHAATLADGDLLANWFTLGTASLIRGLVNRIDRVLIIKEPTAIAKAEQMSSLAALFYVAAFEMVSTALKAYGSRNPTWVKRGSPEAGTVTISREDIRLSFLDCIQRLLAHLRYNSRISLDLRNLSHVGVGDSRSQPFENNSCDAVITSPPYLTRLDYVIGHLPELAVLGLSNADVRTLRQQMIGTPTMQSGTSTDRPIGVAAEQILKRISDHDSYAAKSYYEPNFRQYFEGMTTSMAEIERVCKPHSKVILVVQDSRFKDVHIDLATSLRSMAEAASWSCRGQRDFVNVRSMAQVNTRAHATARATKPVESVLLLETPA